MKRTSRIAVAALAATGAVAGATAAIVAPAWFNPVPNHSSTLVADSSAARVPAAVSVAPVGQVPTSPASESLASLKKREQDLRDRLAAQNASAQANGSQAPVINESTVDWSSPAADPTTDPTQQFMTDGQSTPNTQPSSRPVVVPPAKPAPSSHSWTGASGGGKPGVNPGDDNGYENEDNEYGEGDEASDDDSSKADDSRSDDDQWTGDDEVEDDEDEDDESEYEDD